MRIVATIALIAALVPRPAHTQVASPSMALAPRLRAGPQLPPPARGMQAARPVNPMAQASGGAGMGTVAGWMVGLAVGPSVFDGKDMGCGKVECYGTLNGGEASIAGAIVAAGVGYVLGSVLALAAGFDGDPLHGVRFKVSPKGKPGLRISTSIRF